MMAPDSFAHALKREDDGGSRSGALLLHAVAEDDRQWLLARLAPPQRAALDALLQELALLGLPPDRALIDQALRGAGGATVPPEVALAGACPEQVAQALSSEPDRLVAALLRRDWPWRDELLGRLDPVRRRRIQEALRDAADARPEVRGRGLEEALVEGTLQRLVQRPVLARRPGVLAACRAWLGERVSAWRRRRRA